MSISAISQLSKLNTFDFSLVIFENTSSFTVSCNFWLKHLDQCNYALDHKEVINNHATVVPLVLQKVSKLQEDLEDISIKTKSCDTKIIFVMIE